MATLNNISKMMLGGHTPEYHRYNLISSLKYHCKQGDSLPVRSPARSVMKFLEQYRKGVWQDTAATFD
jgi:hypothetical protein